MAVRVIFVKYEFIVFICTTVLTCLLIFIISLLTVGCMAHKSGDLALPVHCSIPTVAWTCDADQCSVSVCLTNTLLLVTIPAFTMGPSWPNAIYLDATYRALLQDLPTHTPRSSASESPNLRLFWRWWASEKGDGLCVQSPNFMKPTKKLANIPGWSLKVHPHPSTCFSPWQPPSLHSLVKRLSLGFQVKPSPAPGNNSFWHLSFPKGAFSLVRQDLPHLLANFRRVCTVLNLTAPFWEKTQPCEPQWRAPLDWAGRGLDTANSPSSTTPNLFLFLFLATLSIMKHHSSLTRDRTCAPAVGTWSPNHKTTREFLHQTLKGMRGPWLHRLGPKNIFILSFYIKP